MKKQKQKQNWFWHTWNYPSYITSIWQGCWNQYFIFPLWLSPHHRLCIIYNTQGNYTAIIIYSCQLDFQPILTLSFEGYIHIHIPYNKLPSLSTSWLARKEMRKLRKISTNMNVCKYSTAGCINNKLIKEELYIVKTTTQPQHNPKTTPKQPNTIQRKLGLTQILVCNTTHPLGTIGAIQANFRVT